MSLFDIGLSGLRVSQYAMQLIGSNINHFNDPFYSRREVDIFNTNFGAFGTGVRIGDVRRIVDDIANRQLLRTQFDISRSSTLFEHLSQFEVFIDNDDTSVIKFINESLEALEALNAAPASTQSRQHYLNQLQNMVQRFHDVDRRMTQDLSDTRFGITGSLNEVNHILDELAGVNQKLAAQGGQNDSSKLTLYDERDKLLSELAEYMDYNYQERDNGEVELELSNGMSLIVNNNVRHLQIIPGTGPETISIGIESSSGLQSIDGLFSSGKISGLLDYFNDMQKMQMQVDRIALTIAYELNHQNKLGVDANGDLGTNIFNDINSLDAVTHRATANSSNSGSATIGVYIRDPHQLKDSAYELRFDSPTHYVLTRTSDGAVVEDGNVSSFPQSIDVDGFSLQIDAGTFSADDVYILQPTKGSAESLQLDMQDGVKLALGFPVKTSASIENTGNGQIRVDSIMDTANSAFSLPRSLNPPLRIEFLSSTTYRLVNADDGSLVEDNITYDPLNGVDVFPTPAGYDPGYRIHLSGQIEAGDQFAIEYNADGIGDNRNGLLLAELYRQAGDRAGFSQLYQSFVQDVSYLTKTAKVVYESNQVLNEQAQLRRDQISAVTLEEEMSNLSLYQEYFMANAQILDTVTQTMDTLFGLLRR